MNYPLTIQDNLDAVQIWVNGKRARQEEITNHWSMFDKRPYRLKERLIKEKMDNAVLICQAEHFLATRRTNEQLKIKEI